MAKNQINVSKLGLSPIKKAAEQPKPLGAFAGGITPLPSEGYQIKKEDIFTPPSTTTAVSTEEKGTIQEIERAQATQKELIDMPKNAFNDFVNKAKASMEAHKNDNLIGFNNYFTPSTETVGKDLQTEVAAANVFFTPASLAMAAAGKLPALPGKIASTANTMFEYGGKIVSKLSKEALNAMPIPQEAKDNLNQAVGDVGNLIGQALVGGALYKIGGKVMPKKVAEEIQTDFINNVKEAASSSKTPISQEVAKNIAISAAEKTIGKIESVGANKGLGIAERGEPTSAPLPETFTPKSALDMTQKLKEQGLLPENFNDLPIAERITFADQTKRTMDLLQSDIERAKKMISGEEPVPSDIKTGFLLKGIEDIITKTGDAELAQKLANSPLHAETSIHAQELVSMKALQPDSLVSQLADIRSTREKNAAKNMGEKDVATAKSKVAKEIKNEINKKAPKAKDWASFLDEIRCK